MAQMRVAGRIRPSSVFLKPQRRGPNPRISALRRDSTQTTLGGVLQISSLAGKTTSDPISAISVMGISRQFAPRRELFDYHSVREQEGFHSGSARKRPSAPTERNPGP